jgi:hypothetical protein
MRRPTDLPRPPRRRGLPAGRIGLAVIAAALFLILTSLRGIAGFWTDYLWYQELGLTSVWRAVLGAKVALAAVFTVLFFVVLWVNLTIAERLAPRFRPFGPEEEWVQRYREVVGPHAGKVRLGVAALFALIAGLGMSSLWNAWLLYNNRVTFDQTDAQFGRDISFYVFDLPFLSAVVDWAFVAIVIILVLTVAWHYLSGGIRLQSPPPRVTPQVKAHISLLLGVLALVRAVDYYFSRFELTFSTRGAVPGATYTDVNAQLPAINLLIVISIAAFALFVVNIWLRGWTMPAIAVALWALVATAVGTIYPAFVQNFQVEPDEARKERPYIERNLEATRSAYDLTDVEVSDFAHSQDLDVGDLVNNAETIRNIRLWDPAILQDTYQRLQEIRAFFQFNDVDIDRYVVNGELTQIVLSARELDPTGLPSQRQSWVNRHLQFTHGYGAVLSPANAVTRDGQPDFIVKDVPPVTDPGGPEITQPQIYYGENLGSYAIVNTDQPEIDFITTEGGEQTSTYEGVGGIEMSSMSRRIALALRFGEINLVISDSVRSDSRAIYIRDIHDRAAKAAPFLRYDADPYPVVTEGRIKWVLDAFSITNRYPYSTQAETQLVNPRSGLRGEDFNYVRGSVKVVMDAYDGTMTYYIIDDDDPIVAAYAGAFPELFTPGDEMPDELRAHLRYPEDLFRVQTTMYGDYHITSPGGFYSKSDAWEISQDPGAGTVAGVGNGGTQGGIDVVTGEVIVPRERRMDPYYLLMRPPGAEKEEFLILQPFVPASPDDSRKELTAFMIAKSDPGNYGELETFEMPRDRQVDGPAIVGARIQQEPTISEQITLLSRAGSQVRLGNLLVIPIEDSLLYVRPMYVQAEGTPIPEFKFAIVVYGDAVVMRPTLKDALTAIFGDAPETREDQPSDEVTPPPDGDGDGDGAVTAEFEELLQEANARFAEANAALERGQLSEFERLYREALELFRQAVAALDLDQADQAA